MSWEIKHGDMRDVCRELDGQKFHAVLCDPPYGLKFMGKDWDVVSSQEWGEALLPLLYSGALVLMFGGTRTWHKLATGMEAAGFEMWDTLMWLYGSGFPKAQKIQVEGFDGHKTCALKPAWEPILCFKAPTEGKTYAELATKYGSGCLNVDGARIQTNDTLHAGSGGLLSHIRDGKAYPGNFRKGEPSSERRYADHGATNFAAKPGPRGGCPKGRYPANLLLDPESAAMLDEQSGALTSGKADILNRHSDKFSNTYSEFAGESSEGATYGDSGGASRFFYCAKASAAERNAGCDNLAAGILARSCQAQAEAKRGNTVSHSDGAFNKARITRNIHPTVKPINLCHYLATLLLPPDSVGVRRLLVPFSGSGSEIIGALRAGWDHVTAIEQEGQYIQIAVERVINDAPLFNTPSAEVQA
jgi:site-specific DNA-methyltransferase (adenine-specific)